MKSTFLFLVTTTMMTCTALGQPSNDKKNVLPDWAFGGFERPQGANPVISPIENTKFYCPMTQDYVAWESNDTFNPAATLHDGKIVVLYRAEDKSGVGIGHRTSRLGYATSVTAFTSSGKRLRYFIRITILKRNWNGRADAKTRVSPSQQKDCM